MKNKRPLISITFWLGILIVIGSHIYMLLYGLSPEQIIGHSIVNIIAGGLFIFTWYKKQ